MAAESNDSIREFIDLDSVGKQKEVFVKDLKEIYALYQKINNTRLKLEGSSSIKETTDALKKLNQQEKELANINLKIAETARQRAMLEKTQKQAVDELQRTELNLIKTYEKRQTATSNAAMELTKEKILLAETSKEMKLQAREVLGLVTAYDKLQKEFLEASKDAKNLGATLGTESEQYKVAAAKANELNNKLKAIDAGIGNHQRKVGDYASSWTSFNMVLREAPAFANSVQTGLMALSNNIPMFADDIKRARTEGKSWKTILKDLSANLFSFGGIVTIVTTALTFLPKILSAMSSETEKVSKRIKTMSEVQGESLKATQKERIELEALLVVASSENKSKAEKSAAIKKINDMMPDYLGNITEEDIRTGKAQKLIDQYIDSLAKKALAQAYMSKIQEKYVALIDAENSTIEENIEWYNYLWNTIKNGGAAGAAAVDNIKTGVENRKANIKSIGDEITMLNQKFKADLESGKAVLDLDKQEKKSKDELAKKKQELRDRELKAQNEVAVLNVQIMKDMFDSIAGNQKLSMQQRLSAMEQASKLEQKIIILNRDFELKNSKLTNSEREKIKLEAYRNLVQIEKRTQEAITALITEYGEKQKEEELKAADKRIEAIDTKMANRVLRTQTQLNDSLRRLNESFLAGEIDSVESYEQQKAAIMTEYADKNFNEQISNLQDLVAEYTKQGKDTTELEKRISDLKIQYSDVATASAIDNAKKEADAKKLYAEKEKELQQQLYDKRIELARQAAETIKEFLIAPYEVEKNAIQDQINALEIKKNKDIEVAKQTITNQQDQAAAITTINASAQAQREQLEQKQRQVDQQKARFERVYRGFQITASTIEAVAKIKANAAVLASNPITLPLAPMALAQIPVTIGIGAAQLAALFATPIPKYAVGTSNHPGGPAIVGDGGKMEGVITPDGSLYVTPDTPTVTNLPKGSVVIPDVNDITAVAVKNSIPKSMNYDGALMSNLELIGEVKRMRGDITAAIKNKRENHYHVTRHGLLVQQMSDNNQIDYLNENLQF